MSAITKTYEEFSPYNPDESIFVSANAGAGKTRLLTERVLALLLSGVAPSKILCLTFTNAAAAEMAHRVQHELGMWVMADTAKLTTILTRLLERVPAPHELARARSLFATVLESPEGLRMQTIHGLCQSILRRFPLEAGVSPHFGVMEGRTEKALQCEARLRLLTNASEWEADVQHALRALARSQAESRLEQLLGEVFKNKRDLMAAFAPGRDETIRRVWQHVGLAPDTTVEALVQEHFIYTDEQLARLRAACASIHNCPKPGESDHAMAAALATWLEQPGKADNLGVYCSAFLTARQEPLKRLHTKAAVTEEALIQALQQEQQRVLRYSRIASALSLATSTQQILIVAHTLLGLYQELKDSRAMLDFDDQIERTQRLLTHRDVLPWVLYKLDGGIDHLLVDEAQDTSPTQWAIIAALTDEFFRGEGRSQQARSIFIVGDEKQSIFSFQGAQPRELGRWQGEFGRRSEAAGKRALRLQRIKSYRSTGEVLRAVDAVFAQPHVAEGLTYDNTPVGHEVERSGEPGLVELWPLLAPPEKDVAAGDEEEGDAPVRTLPQLAKHIAATIRGWLDEGMMLQGKHARPVEAGDIMILVRNRGRMVDALVRALKKQDVPVAGHDRMELNENLAVQDLVALGNALLLPEDDLTLASVLKTPLFGVTEEDMFTLAYGRGGQPLWEQLSLMRGVNPRFAEAYALLADLRSRADYLPPYELYTYLLDGCGGRARMLGRMGGEYQDPIDEFLGQLLQYERSHTPSLQGFLHWLATSDSQIKRDMEQARGCVRILTVHASKGLQAPIVIMPDTLLSSGEKTKEMFIWQEEGGRLPFWALSDGRNNDAYIQLAMQRDAGRAAEYRRLLYVALTRAADQLYICGARGRNNPPEGSWYHMVRSGLESVAEKMTHEWGEGLRMGALPPRTRRHAAPGQVPQAAAALPFLASPVPHEPHPPQPLVPSRLAGEEASAASPLAMQGVYRRGRIIHQLLQYLPDAPDRAQVAARICAPHIAALGAQTCEAMVAEALRVMDDPQFAFLFGKDALAEVPIAGLAITGEREVAVSGQIDRLYVGAQEVWIVDFKSNQALPPGLPGIPPAYLRQLRLYQLLMQQIYPAKTVHCALLWTALPALLRVEQSRLDAVPVNPYI